MELKQTKLEQEGGIEAIIWLNGEAVTRGQKAKPFFDFHVDVHIKGWEGIALSEMQLFG